MRQAVRSGQGAGWWRGLEEVQMVVLVEDLEVTSEGVQKAWGLEEASVEVLRKENAAEFYKSFNR